MKTSKSFIRTTVENKSIVYLIVAFLVVLGIYGISKMNKDEFPSFGLKEGLVATVYPGASAEEVEEKVAKPLEEVLFSMEEVKRENFKTICKDGICYMYVDLTVPVKEKDEVWSKIRLKISSSKSSLPPTAITVVMDDFSSVASTLITMTSDDKGYSEMKDYADDLSDRLRQIPELASVTVYGGQSEEIALTVDTDLLSSYGISPTSLLLDYQTSSLAMPSGSLKMGNAEYPLHVGSTASSEYEIAEKIVHSDPAGGIVRLKDVATVERRLKEPTSEVTHNGQSALLLSVSMRPDNDIVAFGEEIDKIVDDFSKDLPESVELARITDQPEVVRGSVYSFLQSLVQSILVVILVMMLLFPIRSALIASSGVPVCTATALAIMYLTGIDLNTVTLAALIVVLGMMVDDSIITIDGYMSKRALGLKPIESAEASAKELLLPQFTATTAISVMFFPILGIITGYLGDFVEYFPWVILITLMSSIIYAVTVVPGLEIKYIRDDGKKKDRFHRGQDKFFAAMQKGYDKCVEWCFNNPKTTLIGAVATIVLGVLLFSDLTIQMTPKADRDYFAIEVNLDSDAGLQDTKAVVDSLERMILADNRIESVTSFIGTTAPRYNITYAPSLPSPNSAQMIVKTKSIEATREVLPEYEAKYLNYFPEALLRIKQMDYQAATPVEIIVSGENYEDIRSVSDSIVNLMRSYDKDFQWVHSTSDDCSTLVGVNLDPEEAMRLGVNQSLLSLSLFGELDGQTVATMLDEDGEQIPVTLYDSRSDGSEASYESIGDRRVATAIPSVTVPLRQVAEIEPEWAPAERSRYAGRQAIIINSDMRFGHSQPDGMEKIVAYVDELEIPDGVSIKYAGLTEESETMVPEIALCFVCAVLILFFFLLFHFKKISLAVLTIVMSSLCIFGASLGLWLFNLDFSITAVLGMISLIGIIVRNGIIMFEHAENARTEGGMTVRDAAMDAGKRRMRPIFLTSATTALGVLPLIFSGDLLWMPMAVVICFGTMVSLVIITLVMPVSYWILYYFEDKKKEKSAKRQLYLTEGVE